jgi:hypothetical protein
MAVPTAPTLSTLVSEALTKAGYDSPSATLTTRAEDQFMEEIKNDLAVTFKGKELKFLQAERILTLTDGTSKYSEPTDFFSDINKSIIYGGRIGTAQAGGASSITLAASEYISNDAATGREIAVISGTGANQLREITSYDSTTKVATTSSAWTVNPDATSKYVIIDTYSKICEAPVWELDERRTPYQKGEPRVFYPIGDADNGEFILYPVPWRNITDNAYIIKQRYYASLMSLDLTGTLIGTLYQRWRNLWSQGVKAKTLEWDNDDRAPGEMQLYRDMISAIKDSESYGNLTSNAGQVQPAYSRY